VARFPLISIVDDDDSVRESLRGLFRSVRSGVEAFSSAEEFLSSDRLRHTECLLLDLRMPGMSGLELQRRLVASHPQMPVIFITAHRDEKLRWRALDRGTVDYLLKLFSEEALLNSGERMTAVPNRRPNRRSASANTSRPWSAT
jgi:FixJ family two-component response regulator